MLGSERGDIERQSDKILEGGGGGWEVSILERGGSVKVVSLPRALPNVANPQDFRPPPPSPNYLPPTPPSRILLDCLSILPLSLPDIFPPPTLLSHLTYLSCLSLHCTCLPMPNIVQIFASNPPLTTCHLSTFRLDRRSLPYKRPWFVSVPQHARALKPLSGLKFKPWYRGGAMWQLRGYFYPKGSGYPNHPRQLLKSRAYMTSGHHVTFTHLHLVYDHVIHLYSYQSPTGLSPPRTLVHYHLCFFHVLFTDSIVVI
jgi:hypothetical protein